MVLSALYAFGVILYYVWPAFILPMILALVIYYRYYFDDWLHEFIAALTIKPVIATPLWALAWLILSNFSDSRILVLTIIPGAGLTVIIVSKFWKAVKANKKLAILLLGLDILRWSNTYLTTTTSVHGYSFRNGLDDSSGYIIGLLLPNIYAVIALILCMVHTKRQKSSQLANHSSVPLDGQHFDS